VKKSKDIFQRQSVMGTTNKKSKRQLSVHGDIMLRAIQKLIWAVWQKDLLKDLKQCHHCHMYNMTVIKTRTC